MSEQANSPMPSREDLLDAIANYWGGVGCYRGEGLTPGEFRFGNPDDFNYVVTPPETRTMYFEDDGRPFSGVTPAGVYTVRAIGAAPDDWFTVTVNGDHTNWRGETVNVMPATHHGPWCDETAVKCFRCPSCRDEPLPVEHDDSIDTRSPEWLAGYDAGFEAGRASR